MSNNKKLNEKEEKTIKEILSWTYTSTNIVNQYILFKYMDNINRYYTDENYILIIHNKKSNKPEKTNIRCFNELQFAIEIMKHKQK